MSDLAATDVAVAAVSGCEDILKGGSKRLGVFTVTFGDGAKTYPAGGVPLPDIGKFGFRHGLQAGFVQQPVANGFVYKIDITNKKIKIYTQGVVTGATAAAANTDGAKVTNSAGSEAFPRMSGTAASTTYDLGGMIELPATVAPASVVLTLMLLGN